MPSAPETRSSFSILIWARKTRRSESNLSASISPRVSSRLISRPFTKFTDRVDDHVIGDDILHIITEIRTIAPDIQLNRKAQALLYAIFVGVNTDFIFSNMIAKKYPVTRLVDRTRIYVDVAHAIFHPTNFTKPLTLVNLKRCILTGAHKNDNAWPVKACSTIVAR